MFINLIAFILLAYDKRLAIKRKQHIPEKTFYFR
ncbi:DUF1294 domain-containing protein [Flavobacterium sp.]